MSSIYKRKVTFPGESNRSRIYIKKSISKIGLPCSILVLLGENTSIWPLKNKRSCRSWRKELTQAIRLVRSCSFLRVANSWFFDI